MRQTAHILVACVLAIAACKDNPATRETPREPSPAPQSTPSIPSSEPTGGAGEHSRGGPHPIGVGDTVDGTISFPSKREKIPYETDWYAFDAEAGESVTFRLEATDEERLRPMVSVLLPGDGPRKDWKQVAARRATDGETTVELTFEFPSEGTRLVAVDDLRNVVDGHQPVGGERFTYRLSVTATDR